MRGVLFRLAGSLPALVAVVIVTFILTRVLPGDTATYFAGPTASAESIAQIRTALGLDRPLPEQFWSYVVALFHGDLGMSLTTGQPVLVDILARLPASAELTLCGLLLAMGIAIPLGVLAAVKQGSLADHACRVHRHRRGLAAGLLHRAAAGLCLLLPAGLVAGAAGAAGCLRQRAADGDGLLSDRCGAGRGLGDLAQRPGAARAAGGDARAVRPGADRPDHPGLDAGGAGGGVHPHGAGLRPRARIPSS